MTTPGAAASLGAGPVGSAERPFNLLGWFAVLSLICTAVVALAAGLLLSRFLTDRLLLREAQVSSEFIEAIVRTQGAAETLGDAALASGNARIHSLVELVSLMPDVERANLIDDDSTVVWSSDPLLVGQRFLNDDELEEALAGKLTSKMGDEEDETLATRSEDAPELVEMYIPVWRLDGSGVVGAVEIYKRPRVLVDTIHHAVLLVWLGAALGAAVLYAALLWIVRWARTAIRGQQERLIGIETMAAIGELASAVVHGIRNPLASIRSSAELMLAEDLDGAREAAGDIVGEADRLDGWIRDLLRYAKADVLVPEEVDVNRTVADTIGSLGPALARYKVSVDLQASDGLPPVRANGATLTQVFGSLLVNALEAMPDGGRVVVSTSHDAARRAVEVHVADSGPGLTPGLAAQIFERQVTTKRGGLGIGLSLARRVLSRYGGTIQLSDAAGQGTVATVRLPVAR